MQSEINDTLIKLQDKEDQVNKLNNERKELQEL